MPISATLAARLGSGPARGRWNPYSRPQEASGGGTEARQPPLRRLRGPAQKASAPGSGGQSHVAPSTAAGPRPAQKAARVGSARRSEVTSYVAPTPAPAGRRIGRKTRSQNAVTPGSGRWSGNAAVCAAPARAQKAEMVRSGPRSEVAPTVAATNAAGAAPAAAGRCPERSMTSQNPEPISDPARGDEKPPAEETCSGGGGFVFQCALQGHTEAISGISLPLGSDKLYSGSADGSVRVWDCSSGKCVDVIKMEGKVGCMITYGPWVFIGIPNSVEAWNTETGMKLCLQGPTCLVCSMTIMNEVLFAGTGDGRIMTWNFRPKEISIEPVVILSGHERPVISLSLSARNLLFSSSMDKTIKVWDLMTLQCVQTLSEHKAAVTSVLRWDQKLLSCSLDKTVKVWTTSESGAFEVQHNHAEEHGLRTIFGMHRPGKTPVLLCSLHNSNRIHLFNLPSFSQRGTLFCKKEVRTIELANGGLLFTGDCAGELKIWRWAPQEQEEISEA